MQLINTPKNRLEIYPEQNKIIKYFKKHEDFLKELYIYGKYVSFAPRFISADSKKSNIEIELINGSTIFKIEPDYQQIAKLFHQLHCLELDTICLMDTNPNNILYDEINKRYYLIDFSEWKREKREYDLIHFLLFWASIYSQDKFRKSALAFIESYQILAPIDEKIWKSMLPKVIETFDERRKKFNRAKAFPKAEVGINREFMKNVIMVCK